MGVATAGSGFLDSPRRLGTVLSNEPVGTMRRICVQVPGWMPAKPGQFALLQAEDSQCFLSRALSVSDQAQDTVWFLIAPVGRGTREICDLSVGERVWVLGPLGNGFDVRGLTADGGRILLVGGGAGIAPFPLLVTELTRLSVSDEGDGGSRPEVLVLAGYRDSQQALSCGPLVDAVTQAEARGAACVYEAVTEDSSSGPSERVNDLLGRHLRSGDRVVVCGPEAMAKAVWEVCRKAKDVKVWFSLETNMACGLGSCHGCVVSLADGSYARVCREGPVFSGEEVFGGRP